MADPFIEKNADGQLVREAKIGFSVLLLVIVTLGGWSYWQFVKFRHRIPPHIVNAPVAHHVGPEYYLRNLNRQNPVRTFEHPNNQLISKMPRESRIERSRGTAVAVNAKPSTNARLNAFPSIQPEIPPWHAPIPDQTDRSLVDSNPLAPFDQTSDANPRNNPVANSNPVSPPTATDVSKSFVRNSGTNHRQPSSFDPVKDKTANPWQTPKQLDVKNPVPDNALASDDSGNQVIWTSFDQTQPPHSNQSDFQPLRSANEPTNTNDFQPGNFQSHESDSQNRVGEPDWSQGFGKTEDGNIDEKNSSEIENSHGETTPITSDESNELKRESTFPNPFDTTQQSKFADPMEQEHPQGDRLRQYQTKNGDSFWTIAQQVYEDGRYFRALFAHNRARIDDFESLPVGTILKVPALEQLRFIYPELCPNESKSGSPPGSKNIYLTEEGDTLFEIARQTTGQASQYLKILKLNRKMLPDGVNHLTKLRSGISLQLPD